MTLTDPVTTGNIEIDHDLQAGAEHNAKAVGKDLHEAGFAGVVMEPMSRFTIGLHTRTLDARQRELFEGWAEEQPAYFHVRDDKDGSFWYVNI